MPKSLLKNKVWRIVCTEYKNKGGALTVNEIQALLGKKTSARWIRSIISLLELEKKVRVIRRDKEVFVVPLKCEQKSLFDFVEVVEDDVRTREELADIIEKRQRGHAEISARIRRTHLVVRSILEGGTVSHVIAAQAYQRDKIHDLSEQIIVGIAQSIADEDPVELYAAMFEDLVNILIEFSEEYQSASSVKEKANKLEIIREIRDLIKRVYFGILGVPIEFGRNIPEGGIAVAHISIPSQGYAGRFVYDKQKLREFLKRRIIDKKVVTYVKPNEVGRFSHVGVDSSSFPIKVVIPRFGPRGFKVHINAGVYYKVTELNGDGGEKPQPEIYPKPEALSELDMRSAEDKGYILTPARLFALPESLHERLREALMNKLEYDLVYESIMSPGSKPDVVYLDGRVFPYEHKLDDYVVAAHSRAVRRSIVSFNSLSSLIDRYYGLMVLLGVVKRGHLGFLRPLIIWYAYKKGLIEKSDFLSFILSHDPILDVSDGRLALKLLVKLNLKEGMVPRLFGVVRRFYVMDEDLMEAYMRSAREFDDENRLEFWLKEAEIGRYKGLEDYIVQRMSEPPREIWDYGVLCANGAVIMTYFLPPLDNVNWEDIIEREVQRLPRMEVYVPSHYLKDLVQGNERIKELVDSIVLKPKLGADQYYLGYSEKLEDLYTLVPLPVKMAHLYAKDVRRVLAPSFQYFIIERVTRILSQVEGIEF